MGWQRITAAVLLVIGCGGNSPPDTGAGGGSPSAGGSSGASAGTSGSGAVAGGAGAGGSGAAGSPGSGGAGGGGAAGLSSMLGVEVGTFPGGIGCGGGTCDAGQACCNIGSFDPVTCVPSVDACACASGHCQVVGCRTSTDCQGLVCCAISNPYGALSYSTHIVTSCKASCDPVKESATCDTDADCSAGGCVKGGSDHGIGVCF